MARKRVTGATLAQALGVSQPTVSRRLSGATPFDLTELELVADRLGVTLPELLKRAEAAA